MGIATNDILFLYTTAALFEGAGFKASILLVVPQDTDISRVQARSAKAIIVFIVQYKGSFFYCKSKILIDICNKNVKLRSYKK
jgi:hypothetical protein